ncbi:hypothetical protein EV126DRAFT_407685 [Verticillium dahliae]|nr:hypothetical protein EV126DRAFT_409746 [Verticillium dahliae]KAH6710529.1 hypothetical protein EV126DRAFT_407685 [Verticillium dahliae]
MCVWSCANLTFPLLLPQACLDVLTDVPSLWDEAWSVSYDPITSCLPPLAQPGTAGWRSNESSRANQCHDACFPLCEGFLPPRKCENQNDPPPSLHGHSAMPLLGVPVSRTRLLAERI